MGDAAKAITAVIVLTGLVGTGLAVFAKASDLRDVEEVVTLRVAMIEDDNGLVCSLCGSL